MFCPSGAMMNNIPAPLRMRRSVGEAMIAHARACAPLEACGYVAGTAGQGQLSIPLRNLDNSAEHFTMDPAEQFAALRLSRQRNLSLLAVYHSHPATPARPSDEDIRLAQDPEIRHIIVSLAGAVPDIKAFHMAAGRATPVPLEIIDDIVPFTQ